MYRLCMYTWYQYPFPKLLTTLQPQSGSVAYMYLHMYLPSGTLQWSGHQLVSTLNLINSYLDDIMHGALNARCLLCHYVISAPQTLCPLHRATIAIRLRTLIGFILTLISDHSE